MRIVMRLHALLFSALAFFSLSSCGSDSSENGLLAWVKQAGGYSSDEGNYISSLSDESFLVSGSVGDIAVFGRGEANETALFTGLGSFLARYNDNGTLAWVKSTGDSYCYGFATLPDGSSFGTGWFETPTTFGVGEPNETTLDPMDRRSVFIVRHNQDGTLAWAKIVVSSHYGSWVMQSIAAMPDGSITLLGHFSHTAVFEPGDIGQIALNSAGDPDMFLARYDTAGALTWLVQAGGSSSSLEGAAISSLPDGSFVVGGDFLGAVTFGIGEPNESMRTSAGEGDVFVAKYNPDGSLAWVRRAIGTRFSGISSVSMLSDGSTVAAGYFSDSVRFGPGEQNETTLSSAGGMDVFVARFNPEGNLDWARRAGGAEGDASKSICSQADGKAIITGTFKGAATFGLGESNETILTTTGNADIFIAKFDSHGSLVWARQAGGEDVEYPRGISSLPDESSLVTGSFLGTAIFGPGEANETTLTTDGIHDIFIMRINP
ncbi:MAG: hypothetical protein JRJ87_21405 [Deltaproteobacteria bacterium]|nr:hypothetical protein [Deltaproteobacteria bacterium]